MIMAGLVVTRSHVASRITRETILIPPELFEATWPFAVASIWNVQKPLLSGPWDRLALG